ncbi:MAG: DMT family transporter [Deltaproteobacteria bacterium]
MNSELDPARRTAGVIAALCAVLIWAGWLPITRLGVVTGLTPGDVAALRYGTSGLVLLPLLLMHLKDLPWRRLAPLAIAAIGAGVPYFIVFATGLRLANSGQGAVLGPGASGLFTVLIARGVLGERLRRAQWAGLAITAAGIALVVLHDVAGGGARIGGFLMVLVASLAWAGFTIASRSLRLKPVLLAGFIAVANALLYLPFYVASGGLERLRAVSPHDIALQVLYQGVLTGVVALTAFAFAVARLGAAGAASFTPLSPVLIALFGWLLLGDTVDAATAAGLAAVAAGVLVANRGVRRATAPR